MVRRHRSIVIIGAIVLLFIILGIGYCVKAGVFDLKEKDDFEDFLKTNHITVTGEDMHIARDQLKDLLVMAEEDRTILKKKLLKRLETKEYGIKITSVELLELHYYIAPKEQREEFIAAATGQEVKVGLRGSAITIDY